jgi:hypothetical protein
MTATTKTERICSHDIVYWFEDDDDRELDECDIEHIQDKLIENFVEGEICQYDGDTDETFYGWWQIVSD